jgi:exodeoxyribonuclease VII small subunit
MTQSQATQDPSASEDVPFEQSLAALEKIVHGLEDGQQGLDASLQLYEQGIQHLQRCYRLLDTAEQKIELLMKVDEQGRGITTPFESDGEEEKTAGRARKRSPKS